MNKLTFEEWLKENPRNQQIAGLIKEKHGGSLSQEVQEYLMDSMRRNSQQFLATKKWIGNTKGICHRIHAGVAPEAEYVLFWIYLHGLIIELYNKEKKSKEITMKIPWRRPFVKAIEDLYYCLTESERSFIRFMRHNHVHILVDYPWQQVRVKDGIIAEVREAHDPDAIQNAEMILEHYKGDQNAAAVDFMTKTIRAVDTLDEAFTEATAI